MDWQESGDMRLGITRADAEIWALVTQVRGASGWEPAATGGFRPVDSLEPTEVGLA